MASNEVQILKNHTTSLKIETTTIIAKIKQKQLKLAIAGKNKAIFTIFIKNVECSKYYKKAILKVIA